MTIICNSMNICISVPVCLQKDCAESANLSKCVDHDMVGTFGNEQDFCSACSAFQLYIIVSSRFVLLLFALQKGYTSLSYQLVMLSGQNTAHQPVLCPQDACQHGCWSSQHSAWLAGPQSHGQHSMHHRCSQHWRCIPHDQRRRC